VSFLALLKKNSAIKTEDFPILKFLSLEFVPIISELNYHSIVAHCIFSLL